MVGVEREIFSLVEILPWGRGIWGRWLKIRLERIYANLQIWWGMVVEIFWLSFECEGVCFSVQMSKSLCCRRRKENENVAGAILNESELDSDGVGDLGVSRWGPCLDGGRSGAGTPFFLLGWSLDESLNVLFLRLLFPFGMAAKGIRRTSRPVSRRISGCQKWLVVSGKIKRWTGVKVETDVLPVRLPEREFIVNGNNLYLIVLTPYLLFLSQHHISFIAIMFPHKIVIGLARLI